MTKRLVDGEESDQLLHMFSSGPDDRGPGGLCLAWRPGSWPQDLAGSGEAIAGCWL